MFPHFYQLSVLSDIFISASLIDEKYYLSRVNLHLKVLLSPSTSLNGHHYPVRQV